MTNFKTILVLKRVEVPEEKLNTVLGILVEEKYDKYLQGFEVRRNISILPSSLRWEQEYVRKFGKTCADATANIHTYFDEGNLLGIYSEAIAMVMEAYNQGKADERERIKEEGI